jgi:hypothetical protein
LRHLGVRFCKAALLLKHDVREGLLPALLHPLLWYHPALCNHLADDLNGSVLLCCFVLRLPCDHLAGELSGLLLALRGELGALADAVRLPGAAQAVAAR